MSKLKIVGVVLLVVIGFVLLSGLIWGFNWVTAPFRGALEKREQIQASGDFRIYSYNHFYDLCRTIQEAEAEYDNQFDLLQGMSGDEESYSRQRRTVAVLKSRIERLKRTYNADARKEETTASFKATDLPDGIGVEPHKYGERTQCTY